LPATKFDKPFNQNKHGEPTPAVFDQNVDQWMFAGRNYLNNGTLWIPQKCDDEGIALTKLSGSNAYQTGNPFPISQDCTAANTNYDIDVNTGLARNGHFGLIQAHEANAGIVSVWISYNGTAFTASAIARLQAGSSLTLDGLDIDTIRVQSTVAGDDVVGGVW
jgi:hypothetical protein